MGKDDLNDKIRDRLIDHEEFIDKGELWTSLGMEEEKKRKPLIFWFIGSGIFAIFLTIIGYGLFLNPKSTDNHSKTIFNNNGKNSFAEANNQNTAYEDTSTLNNILSNEEELNDSKSISSTTSTNKIHFAKETNSKHTSQTNSSIVHNNNRSISNNSEAISTNTFAKNQVEDNKPNQVNIADSKLDKEPEKEVIAESNSFINLTQIDALNLRVLSYEKTVLPISIDQEPFIKPVQKQKSYFSGFAYGGAGLYQRQLNLQNQNLQELYQIRKNNEKTLESLTVGLGIKYNFHPNIYVKGGIDYTRYTESYRYSTTDTKEVFDTLFQDVNVNYAGDTTYSNPGLVIGYQEVSDNFTYYNMIHTINIPILLGYQYDWGKWRLFVETGPVFNLGMIFRGHLVGERGTVMENPSQTFKSSIGLGIEGGLGLSYQVSPMTSIFASPSMRYMFNSITKDEYGIEHTVSNWNIRLGLERRF